MFDASPPLHVLIVEDEALLAMDLESMIIDAGHEVVGEARSADEVSNCLCAQPPELAFVDMNLADGSTGLEAATIIHDRWPDAVVIFITANESRIPDNFSNAMGVIGKPFSASGISLSMQFLARAIDNPPPPFALPTALRLSPNAASIWVA